MELVFLVLNFFFFSSRRRHTRCSGVSWARDVYKRQARSPEGTNTSPCLCIEGLRRRTAVVPARRGVLTAWPFAMIALAGLEYVNVPLPTVAAPPRATAVGQWLAGEPGA